MRLSLITILALLAACSDVKKDHNTESAAEPKTAEVTQQEGIIIPTQPEVDTLKGSLKAYATGAVGDASITINYYSPATRGRMVWGGLVAYDNVWVTGAHKATNIEFETDVTIGGTKVTAGKYAIFTIPGENEWTVILNKNWNQHLADDYSAAEDVVRIKVTPEANPSHQERLRYIIKPESDSSGSIEMSWDKVKIDIPFNLADAA